MSKDPSEHLNITRQVDPEDQEKESIGLVRDEVVEESDGHKKSVAGFLGHVRTKLKNAKTCPVNRDS